MFEPAPCFSSLPFHLSLTPTFKAQTGPIGARRARLPRRTHSGPPIQCTRTPMEYSHVSPSHAVNFRKTKEDAQT